MKRRRRVALIIETSNEYARGLLHGIRAYIREHDAWDIDLDERRRGEATGSLAHFKGDGVIARIENAAIAAEVLASRLPCVDVSAARQVPGIPWVETDDAAIARLAFEHLRDKGLRHFAYCGDASYNWSRWREEAFVGVVRRAGFDCATFPEGRGIETESGRAGAPVKGRSRDAGRVSVAGSPVRRFADSPLPAWLRSLPTPVGVMACFDLRGRQLLTAAKLAELRVPDDVAVIGVDNDELLCDLADPPLTSVAPDTDATGYLAAELLDRMMGGRDVAPAAHLLKPIGVVPRLSTDTLAVADPQLAAAVRYLRAHACEGINVEDVLRQVPMPRRTFEAEFKRLFGHMPHDELVETRLRRVKELLSQTDLPLHAIAARSGFKHAEYLSVVFKRHTGQPPSAYRARKGRAP